MRLANEDFVWSDPDRGIYVLVDGMGGMANGEIAGELAATYLGEVLGRELEPQAGDASGVDDAVEAVAEAIEGANQVVLDRGIELGTAMGAVVVLAVVKPPLVHIAHAGDARAYLFRRDELTRLTEDDSVVGAMLATGRITEGEAKKHRLRGMVTKALGQDTLVYPTVRTIGVEPKDLILLCSDGLWSMLPDAQLAELLAGGEAVQPTVEALVRSANAAGGHDNISVILIELERIAA
jgi:protein phosphatase